MLMGDKSKIEFCDATINPVIGCTHAGSPGCDNCWSKRLHNQRHKAYREGKRVPHQYAHPFSKVKLLPERIDQVFRWKKPKRIFWCSTSDLFHSAVPEDFIGRCRWAMAATPHHTHIVITKRAQRLLESSRGLAHYPNGDRTQRPRIGWPPNVIVMVTVTNQQEADRDIPLLLQVEAKCRGVIVEPMLGPVDLTRIDDRDFGNDWGIHGDALYGGLWERRGRADRYKMIRDTSRLDWVVAGPETGPHRRCAELEWFLDLKDQAESAGVPFFLKALDIGGKIVKMPTMDGSVWDQFPA